ncbi:MAG: ECF transporter S component, partial [Eggerthellaceae bacterium]|nr:ECF transporter S component [Eggerthellaceae bacterium]
MSEQYNSISNTNIYDTRQLVTMALMAALAAILSFVELPIFPMAPYLKYDPSLVPSMVTGFAYGAGPGVLVGIVAALIHGLITSNWIGAAINILVTIFFIAPAAL